MDRGMWPLKQIAYLPLLVSIVRHRFHCSCGVWEKKTQNRLGRCRGTWTAGQRGAVAALGYKPASLHSTLVSVFCFQLHKHMLVFACLGCCNNIP